MAVFNPDVWATPTNYLSVSFLVLIVCEHMSTAQEEYRMVWKRKLSLPTALFLINRYVLLFIAVMYPLSTLLWWRDDFSCVVISNARISLSVALLAVNVVFTSLRVHAINYRNWWWTALVLLVGLVSVVLNIIVFASATTGTNAPNARGCYGTLGVVGHSRSEWVRESLVIRGCTIVQDVLVLGITWYRTSGIVAGLSIASTPVASVLLRNGATYFLIMLCVNSAAIATVVGGLSALTPQIHILNAIIMSRFILNLRTAASCIDNNGVDTTLPFDTHGTQSYTLFSSGGLGNMGAPVWFAGDFDEEEGEEGRD